MRHLLAAALLGLALAGCGGGGGADTGALTGVAGGGDVTVQLEQQNDSGQTGTAALTANGEKTSVFVLLDIAGETDQPAHIHEGTCEDLGDVAHGLQNLSGGQSESTVDVSLEELQKGDYAVNVHLSEAEIETYVSCGNIPKADS